MNLSSSSLFFRITLPPKNAAIIIERIATIIFETGFEITSEPRDIVATEEGKEKISIGVAGEVASYKWQYRKTATSSWNNLSVTGNYVNVTVSEARNGYQYRCIVTGANGEELVSRIVTIIFEA